MSRVLILGAGLVSKPIVDYLLSKEGMEVTVASRTVSKAEKLVGDHPRGQALPLDVQNVGEVDDLVAAHDLTVSLVPYAFHVQVARLCMKHKKNMITTSYISPEMRALDPEARDAGILVLNELGLDPGIDHMSAMKIIHDVERRGGKVVSFKSYCGGLPAPEANTNPWGYKFSWSPRGVLLASRNSARYLWDGEVTETPAEKLFEDNHMVKVDPMGDFEAYPNRNSTQYIELYGLQEAHTMFRGTLRNPGWCSLMQRVVKLGLLDLEERDTAGMTYRGLMASLAGCDADSDVAAETASYLGLAPDSPEIQKLSWAGLFEDRPIGVDQISPLDALLNILLEKIELGPQERDMIVLHHDFVAEVDGGKEKITSTMVDYGIPGGDTAVSRTVSLPAAVGTDLILQGRISLTGVHMPNLAEIYDPVLDELEKLDIVCEEHSQPLT
jgi:saccharopine dehydrogenase-like NADP-dependent oxidoreductase